MKNNNSTYKKDFKITALSLLSELGNVSKVAEELKIPRQLPKSWQKEYEELTDECSPGSAICRLNTDEKKIYELEKKLEISNLHFKILKSIGKVLYMGQPLIFKFMLEKEKTYSVRMMCSALCINRSSYYRWKQQTISETQKRKILIKQEIATIFLDAKHRYGSQRINVVLKKSGYHVSDSTVNSYMKEMGLSSKLKGATKKVKTIIN